MKTVMSSTHSFGGLCTPRRGRIGFTCRPQFAPHISKIWDTPGTNYDRMLKLLSILEVWRKVYKRKKKFSKQYKLRRITHTHTNRWWWWLLDKVVQEVPLFLCRLRLPRLRRQEGDGVVPHRRMLIPRMDGIMPIPAQNISLYLVPFKWDFRVQPSRQVHSLKELGS